MSIKLIMPMAGEGNRFKEKGYDVVVYNLLMYRRSLKLIIG